MKDSWSRYDASDRPYTMMITYENTVHDLWCYTPTFPQVLVTGGGRGRGGGGVREEALPA